MGKRRNWKNAALNGKQEENYLVPSMRMKKHSLKLYSQRRQWLSQISKVKSLKRRSPWQPRSKQLALSETSQAFLELEETARQKMEEEKRCKSLEDIRNQKFADQLKKKNLIEVEKARKMNDDAEKDRIWLQKATAAFH